MSTRLTDAFTCLRRDGRKALIIYITAGDPDVDGTVALAKAVVEAGADILEVGIPFSDPVADGPVIERAMLRALHNGGGFAQAVDIIRRVRAAVSVPVIAFGYINPLLWNGLEASCQELAAAGADGVLVVDVTVEEAGPLRTAAEHAGLAWVPLVAPTTGVERLRTIARQGTGFLYVVSMTGVTGGALHDVTRLQPLVAAARAAADLPVCIGFGVRDQASAARAAALADGVVVGSAVVGCWEDAAGSRAGLTRVRELVGALRAGVDG